MEDRKILDTFDYQISIEIQYSNIENCLSYWNKKLYLLSQKLSFQDWKKIRQGDYYHLKDFQNNPLKEAKFVASRIKSYLDKKN